MWLDGWMDGYDGWYRLCWRLQIPFPAERVDKFGLWNCALPCLDADVAGKVRARVCGLLT